MLLMSSFVVGTAFECLFESRRLPVPVRSISPIVHLVHCPSGDFCSEIVEDLDEDGVALGAIKVQPSQQERGL